MAKELKALDPKAKVVVMNFADESAGELEIDVEGITYVYNIVQYTSSWALNEIPAAEVTVPVGRVMNGDETGNLATIHASASKLRRLYRARVYSTVSGTWDATGKTWPGTRLLLFEGYFEGFGSRNSEDGKASVVVFLRHWLLQLAFSSSISAISHAGNPWQMSSRALAVGAGGTSALDEFGLVGWMPLSLFIAGSVDTDLWGAIKQLISKIASTSTVSVNITSQCLSFSSESPLKNDVALDALKRIEGPSVETGMAYEFGCPLVVDPNLAVARLAISDTLANTAIRSLANATIWDKLVGELLPMFGMAIVPMVDRAIVIALNPLYNQNIWRTIPASDYESSDTTKRFSYPLRGVGVHAMFENPTGQLKEAQVTTPSLTGGCFIADAIKPGEGVYKFVDAPMWLSNYANSLTGGSSNGDLFKNNQAGPSDTGTNQTNTSPPASPDTINQAYNLYAQFVYVANNLAESVGTYACKYRYDLAPGCMVRVQSRKQSDDDTLSIDEIGMVNRVTVFLSAEGPGAGTSIVLSNVRSETDYKDKRFGVPRHPLFTAASIHGVGKHGCPLMPAFKDYT